MPSNQASEQELLVLHILDAIRRTVVHYGLWFSESVHQFGLDAALAMEREAGDRLLALTLGRLCRVLDIPLRDTESGRFPEALLRLDNERLTALHDALCANWLACDGVWFQAAEAHTPAAMHDAKRVNDTCWSRFSPFEAGRIKALLQLPDPANPREALELCKTALHYRLYARINEQEIVEETPDSFVFRMSDCRVQSARKRKGLEDYPCKSGGSVEYATFALALDPRIRVTCLACPPDPHPEEWYCAWRFSI